MKKALKILLWAMISFFGLILIAGLITQTSLFKGWLKDYAVSELNQILDADLSIGDLEGNLLYNLEIQELILSANQDTIISITEIDLSYDLLRLLADEIAINNIRINSPNIILSEDSTGIWNFDKIVRHNGDVDTTIQENDRSFPYLISLDSLIISNGYAEIKTKEKLIPDKVNNLYINLNGRYNTEMLELNLDSLAFLSENPNLILNKFAFNFKQDGDGLQLRNLTLKTGMNNFTSEAEYFKEKNNYLNFNSKSLNLNEINFILPGFTLEKNPDIHINSVFNQDSLEIAIDIQSEGENIVVTTLVENYRAYFEDYNRDAIYFNVDVRTPGLKLEEWFEFIPIQYMSGEISIKGSLTDLSDLQAHLMGAFDTIELPGYSADLLVIDAEFNQNDFSGDLHFLSEYANIDMEIGIRGVMEIPAYTGRVFVTNLELAPFISENNFSTDLNFNLSIEGSGDQISNQKTFLELAILPSRIDELEIDSSFARGTLSGTAYNLETLQINSKFAYLALAGQGNLDSSHTFLYDITIRDFQTLSSLVGADTIQSSGQISGRIRGDLASIDNDMSFALRNLQYNDLKLDSLAGNAILSLQDSLLSGSTAFESKDLLVGNQVIEEIGLSANYENGHISSDLQIQIDPDLRISLTATIIPDTVVEITLPRIGIDFVNEHWNGSIKKLSFDRGTDDLEVKEFLLQSQISEDPRKIAMNGILSLTGNEDFALQLEGLRPGSFFSYFGVENEIDAKINANLEIGGTADKPLINGDLSFEDGTVGAIKYKGIYSAFDYKDNRFDVNFLLNFNDQDSLILKGNLPVHLSFTDSANILDPDAPIYLNIRSESIPLAIFMSNLKIFPEVSGDFQCDLAIDNNLNDPKINGNLKIINGLIRSAYWGIDYQKINLNVLAEDDKFLLEKFIIHTNNGKLEAAGAIQFDFDNIEKPVVYSDLNLKAENFFLLKHKDFETQLSADIKYNMEEDQPKVVGFIEVNRSNFYLPTVMNRAGYVTDVGEKTKPVLLQARNKKLGIDGIEGENLTQMNKSDTLRAPGFLEKLEGNLAIRIPRNTWVRNPQLRLELGGDIQMTMDKGDVFFKGPLKFVRGQYDLFGRRFTVIQGNIEFQGKQEINPPILLEAEYIYRTTSREKKALVLKITGNLKYPVVSFFESNNKISPEDAISIVLYGHKKDELSYGNQTDLAESGAANTAAMGIVSNFASDRLSRTLGDDLKLDVVEVNAQDNWQGANFVVGKYITENIFLTYKREFGQSQDNNLYPETITMEYEIIKNLFFQMIQGDPRDSGYDLLFKFDWD